MSRWLSSGSSAPPRISSASCGGGSEPPQLLDVATCSITRASSVGSRGELLGLAAPSRRGADARTTHARQQSGGFTGLREIVGAGVGLSRAPRGPDAVTSTTGSMASADRRAPRGTRRSRKPRHEHVEQYLVRHVSDRVEPSWRSRQPDFVAVKAEEVLEAHVGEVSSTTRMRARPATASSLHVGVGVHVRHVKGCPGCEQFRMLTGLDIGVKPAADLCTILVHHRRGHGDHRQGGPDRLAAGEHFESADPQLDIEERHQGSRDRRALFAAAHRQTSKPWKGARQ